MRASDILLIGVDGGATEVKAHTVCCDNLEAPSVFDLGPGKAARKYERYGDFQPLPIADQLTQRKSGRLELDDAERRQGDLWVQACIDAIADAASDSRCDGLLIGVGMPGLKTDDGRGIDAINHGPRIPDYLEHLERGLSDRGIKLAAPIDVLGSDADYCGLGEQYASGGLFGDVDHAYYLGGGTGLADAMKLGGELIPFDRAAGWILKSWEM
ncbi:MAG: hypothetical protein ACE5GE_06445, partial [Phycisphaerae bacterium]